MHLNYICRSTLRPSYVSTVQESLIRNLETAKIEPYHYICVFTHKMLSSFILRFIFKNSNERVIVLGRWGYHWDINKKIQRYYD